VTDPRKLASDTSALDKIERLLRAAERDARLLDGRNYKHRRFAEAYRLLDILRERAAEREEEK
jgi:hypothetical protein